jgi:hypothetical protein
MTPSAAKKTEPVRAKFKSTPDTARRRSVPKLVPAGPASQVAPKRPHGDDDLVVVLFEAMFELFFTKDAIEGGRFCLSVLAERLPSRLGFVHLYDINKREFVTVGTHGEGADAMLLARHPESDALLADAMNLRRAVVLESARPGKTDLARFKAAGPVRSVVVAPVMDGGRFLGAIELVNPLDELPFGEREGNATSYVAERFAEFVAGRGVSFDPERIKRTG